LLTSQLEDQRSIFEKKLVATVEAYETDEGLREERERLASGLDELSQLNSEKQAVQRDLQDRIDKMVVKQKDWHGKTSKLHTDSEAELDILRTQQRNHSLLKEDNYQQQ